MSWLLRCSPGGLCLGWATANQGHHYNHTCGQVLQYCRPASSGTPNGGVLPPGGIRQGDHPRERERNGIQRTGKETLMIPLWSPLPSPSHLALVFVASGCDTSIFNVFFLGTMLMANHFSHLQKEIENIQFSSPSRSTFPSFGCWLLSKVEMRRSWLS